MQKMVNSELAGIKKMIYDKCALQISGFKNEPESKDYEACQFQLNERNIICRNAKTTPKKAGQFVTFWKRNGKGPIEPFHETDPIDFYVVNVQTKKQMGQFVFPKSALIKKEIISTDKKEGKRAFRVYPSWDVTHNKQAEQAQKWQLNYFYEINNSTDLKRVIELYKNK
ncbi:MepB family protein [Sinomicrobium sp. M5D2P17]